MTIDFDGRYRTIGGSDRRSDGTDENGKGGTLGDTNGKPLGRVLD